MLKEFKAFAMRGNVIDLAIGIIIGSAFNKIITSFVNDVLMPPIGLLLGKVDFANLFFSIQGEHYATLKATQDAGAITINYGIFINTIIDFLIVVFFVFLLVKQINRLSAKPAPALSALTTKECPFCFSTINNKATRCPNCTSELGDM